MGSELVSHNLGADYIQAWGLSLDLNRENRGEDYLQIQIVRRELRYTIFAWHQYNRYFFALSVQLSIPSELPWIIPKITHCIK